MNTDRTPLDRLREDGRAKKVFSFIILTAAILFIAFLAYHIEQPPGGDNSAASAAAPLKGTVQAHERLIALTD